jgi:hypothetical protein
MRPVFVLLGGVWPFAWLITAQMAMKIAPGNMIPPLVLLAAFGVAWVWLGRAYDSTFSAKQQGIGLSFRYSSMTMLASLAVALLGLAGLIGLYVLGIDPLDLDGWLAASG